MKLRIKETNHIIVLDNEKDTKNNGEIFIEAEEEVQELNHKEPITLEAKEVQRTLRESEFFKLQNNIDEDVLHQYYRCNFCQIEPIWGTRFVCSTCGDFDLCEACFDKNLEKSIPTNNQTFKS